MLNTKELIDRIFKEPGIKFELTEFENLGKPIHDIILIHAKAATTGKDESYEKCNESKRLLEQAKTRVEQLIEATVRP